VPAVRERLDPAHTGRSGPSSGVDAAWSDRPALTARARARTGAQPGDFHDARNDRSPRRVEVHVVAAANRRDLGELGAALATAVIHVLPLERWVPEVIEIAVACSGWTGYLAYLSLRDRARLREMGFRREGLGASAAAALALFGIATLAMAIWGFASGTLRVHPHMLILAALYPLWGLVQQWLIQGIVARQLAARTGALPAVIATSVIFGVLHLPDGVLAIGTFVLGLAITPMYLRWRNVWPLGVVHGWLAIPTYFWIAGVDPWSVVTAGG
jgi:membrane protease YdiL (CAAX protease family)